MKGLVYRVKTNNIDASVLTYDFIASENMCNDKEIK